MTFSRATKPRATNTRQIAKVLPAAVLSLSLFAGACAEDTTTSATGEGTPIEDSTPDLDAANALDADDATAITSGVDTLEVNTPGADSPGASAPGASAFDAPPTQEEQDGLAFMREEEKLAGDVYRAMFELWGLTIFDNIASAEDTHTASVARLLDQYGLEDPAEGLAPGVFSDPQLQALYDELIANGSRSETDALMVGALIEELDIADLRERATDNHAIATVYARLERGSNNHLRAFVRQLERRGVDYEPVHLSQDAFDEILATPRPRGGGRRSA